MSDRILRRSKIWVVERKFFERKIPNSKKIRSKASKNTKSLPRCFSEPVIRGVRRNRDVFLLRQRTCSDMFGPPKICSSYGREMYNEDTRVLVNVTVEGNVSPVRVVVRMGASVEETIKIAVNRYCEEGRRPCIDRDASFELHYSHFCLQSLDKAGSIGQMGNRNFYLRKCTSVTANEMMKKYETKHSQSQLLNHSVQHAESPVSVCNSLPPLIARKINKVITRTLRIWKIFGCIDRE